MAVAKASKEWQPSRNGSASKEWQYVEEAFLGCVFMRFCAVFFFFFDVSLKSKNKRKNSLKIEKKKPVNVVRLPHPINFYFNIK